MDNFKSIPRELDVFINRKIQYNLILYRIGSRLKKKKKKKKGEEKKKGMKRKGSRDLFTI